MAIALAEADKYEILDKIGKCNLLDILLIFVGSKLIACICLGCGSFGIIRKVKRKTDGFVSLVYWCHVTLY
jgi:hypothetical protein